MKATTALLLVFSFAFIGVHAQDARKAYVQRYAGLAVMEMERTGIPASIKLAQAILESRYGTSELATRSNNHFGIKCGSRWKGGVYYKKDDDYNQRGELIPSCFRSYYTVEESFVAHSNFLTSGSRYADLFRNKTTDYKAWAKGLKKAGYATARDYHKKLIRIIDELKLYKYDRLKSGAEELLVLNPPGEEEELAEPLREKERPHPELVSPPERGKRPFGPLETLSQNDVKYVVSIQDETPESLAERLDIPVRWLIAYNEQLTSAEQKLSEGVRIYIQPKRNSYRGKEKFHVVKHGEDMFDISQMYAISLNKLYERNHMIQGTQPQTGVQIKLKGSRLKKAPALQAVAREGVSGQERPSTSGSNFNQPASTRPSLNFFESAPSPPSGASTGHLSSGSVYHAVKSGESLQSIAQEYNTTVQSIRSWNNLSEGVMPAVGTRIRVQ